MSFYNLIEAEKRRIHFPNNPLPQQAFYKLKNIHRAEQSLKFLQKCDDDNLHPNFLKISMKNVKNLGLKSAEMFKLKKRIMTAEKNLKLERIKIGKIEFQNLSLQIKNLCAEPENHYKFINYLKHLSKKSEFKSDMIRDRKLRNLAYSKKTDYNRIKVHNRTNITIPTDVLEILKLG